MLLYHASLLLLFFLSLPLRAFPFYVVSFSYPFLIFFFLLFPTLLSPSLSFLILGLVSPLHSCRSTFHSSNLFLLPLFPLLVLSIYFVLFLYPTSYIILNFLLIFYSLHFKTSGKWVFFCKQTINRIYSYIYINSNFTSFARPVYIDLYNTRKFKQDWKTPFDPNTVGFWNAGILTTMIFEHL